MTPVSGRPNYYTLQIVQGMNSGAPSYLSVPSDGTLVDLWYEDDGSGR